MVRSSVYVELASELEITKALTYLKLMDIPKVTRIVSTTALLCTSVHKLGLRNVSGGY